MSLPPAKAREAVLIALFALTSHESSSEALSPEGLVLSVMHQLKITRARAKEALQRAFLVFEQKETLKVQILKTCTDYSWNRLGRIEQVVLLLCLFEIQEAITPPKVLLAEASRLGKKFASISSARFVNAVLDAIIQNKQIEVDVISDPMIDELNNAIEKGYEVHVDASEEPEEV